METIWIIIDSSGIDYEGGSDEIMGAYTSKELAEKALEEYERSEFYQKVDKRSDWHIADISEYEVNKNLWPEE